MKKYSYTDRSKYPAVSQIFECHAQTIIEADGKYKEATGKDPASQPHIHCSIEPLKAG